MFSTSISDHVRTHGRGEVDDGDTEQRYSEGTDTDDLRGTMADAYGKFIAQLHVEPTAAMLIFGSVFA